MLGLLFAFVPDVKKGPIRNPAGPNPAGSAGLELVEACNCSLDDRKTASLV